MRVLERDWDRPPPTPAEVRADLVVGLVASVACVISVELYRSAFGVDVRGAEAYVLFGVAGLALAGRRRFPLGTLLVEAVLFIVIGERMQQLAAAFTIQMILFATLWAAWAWSRRARALYAVTALVIVAMFVWLVYLLLEVDDLPSGQQGLIPAAVAAAAYSIVINLIYFFGAIAWGQGAWRSARRREALADQHERERADQAERRRQAVRDERVRIARELHDVVAHHVSSIGVQAAGASRVLARDPDEARGALSQIESSSREAVTQMHQLVGLLREQGESEGGVANGDRAPQPGLADLATLAGGERPVVHHDLVGEPFAVPPTVGHSLYRIAQEAVTNARRHSGAQRATLVVRHLTLDDGHREVEVEVTDDGRGSLSRPLGKHPGQDLGQDADGGFGLTGIRERAALHGGTTEIGPRPQGGFRVRARLPVSPREEQGTP